MRNVLFSTLGLVAVLSTPTFAADFDKQAWSDDLRQEFTNLRVEAINDISDQNMDEIKARDERMVKVIREEQEKLAVITCDKTTGNKS